MCICTRRRKEKRCICTCSKVISWESQVRMKTLASFEENESRRGRKGVCGLGEGELKHEKKGMFAFDGSNGTR